MENRATITVDEYIMGWVQNPQAIPGTKLGYAAVVGQLWERLVDKGDDPRYKRLVFSPNPKNFRIINERALQVTGVFARYSAVSYSEDRDPGILKTIFGSQREDTLVVVPDIDTERQWGMNLAGLGYNVHKI